MMNVSILFCSFFQIGLCSIGGGYAVIPLIRREAVVLNQWITPQEFMDIVTISQMTPGPLAVNTSTFVGLRLGGIPGASAATLGCVLPGILISLLLYSFFTRLQDSPVAENTMRALRASSAGLIASAAATILCLVFPASDLTNPLSDLTDPLSALTAPLSALTDPAFASSAFTLAISLFLLRRFHLNPIFIMLGSGFVGAAAYFLKAL